MRDAGSTNVPAEIESLFSAMGSVISTVYHEAADAAAEDDYPLARDLTGRAEHLAEIREHLEAVLSEWNSVIGDFADSVASGQPQSVTPEASTTAPSLEQQSDESGTPQQSYFLPILQTLVEMGGSGRTRDVVDRVGQLMEGDLTDHDRETTPSSSTEPRWRANARWARDKLVKAGWMEPTKEIGLWEISDSGRRYLEEQER